MSAAIKHYAGGIFRTAWAHNAVQLLQREIPFLLSYSLCPQQPRAKRHWLQD